MSDKHTPGPWFAIETPLYKSSAFYIEGSGKDHRSPYVAHIPRSTIQPMQANARLIASAPDLLEALVDAVETIKAMSGKDLSCDPQEDVSEFEAVIAKATGERA